MESYSNYYFFGICFANGNNSTADKICRRVAAGTYMQTFYHSSGSKSKIHKAAAHFSVHGQFTDAAALSFSEGAKIGRIFHSMPSYDIICRTKIRGSEFIVIHADFSNYSTGCPLYLYPLYTLRTYTAKAHDIRQILAVIAAVSAKKCFMHS